MIILLCFPVKTRQVCPEQWQFKLDAIFSFSVYIVSAVVRSWMGEHKARLHHKVSDFNKNELYIDDQDSQTTPAAEALDAVYMKRGLRECEISFNHNRVLSTLRAEPF